MMVWRYELNKSDTKSKVSSAVTKPRAFPTYLGKQHSAFARHRVAVVSCLLASSTLFTGSVWAQGGAAHVETEAEKIIGRIVARALEDTSGVDTDPLLTNWVQGIGGRVAAPSFRTDLKVNFTILGTDTANALETPGGHVFVTRGLLDSVDSDDELATVLAHEVGHHNKRHAIRQIEGNALFLAFSSVVGPKIGRGGRVGLTVYNVLRTLRKSREMEAQADEVGIGFAYQAGYDPRGLVRFFEGFDSDKRSALEELLATHPSSQKRVAAANQNPLVTKPDATERERTAAGFEARGMAGAAAQVRTGRDPLVLPPVSYTVPAFLADDRRQVVEQAEKVRKSLQNPYKTERFGNTLQQVLLVNNQADPRWIYVASRAYSVQTRVEDLLSRTVRVARTAPGTYEALSVYANRPAGDPASVEGAVGRGEVRRALERVRGAATPIGRAARAVDFVLVDLNNRFLRTNNTIAWTRYLALELILRYAESELARSDKMSGEAWRLLSLARIRRYEQRLNDLAPQNDPARRALWYDLAQRRFGAAFPTDGPAGPATVRAALAVETGGSATTLEQGRGTTSWAEWVVRKKGIPENVATAIRLLTLDLEREVAARSQFNIGQ